MPIDYAIAKTMLAELFVATEAEYNERRPIAVEDEVSAASETVFRSASQGYREALLGCAIARLLDATSNIRFPYIQQGDNAYNGRTLDEEVINPLLVEKMIPCSRGPYLSMFRRDFKFIDEKVHGVRDKTSFRAFLGYIAFLEQADEQRIEVLIKHLIQRFLELRERENVPIFRIARLSVEQFKVVFDDMLQVPSGGFIPMMFTIAMIKTIKECYNLPWAISWQGINVADRALDESGDITVRVGEEIFLAIEVTEREIGQDRVTSTFNTKILRNGIEDYLFIYSTATPTEGALRVSQAYFAQGHDINFYQIRDWLVHNMSVMGSRCRTVFIDEVVRLLGERGTPARVKIAWNEIVRRTAGQL